MSGDSLALNEHARNRLLGYIIGGIWLARFSVKRKRW
jgi:hypothetical protein